MTADQNAAGAASHAEEGWHTINWKSAFRIVCRLQARIVKAIQAGRWGKAKALLRTDRSSLSFFRQIIVELRAVRTATSSWRSVAARARSTAAHVPDSATRCI